jgi:integrase
VAKRRKLWSLTKGGYGYSVRVYERRIDGPISIRFWDPVARKWVCESLGHSDKEAAEASAEHLSGTLLATGKNAALGVLTIDDLLTRYEKERSIHKKGNQAEEDARRNAIWTAFLGKDCEVLTLDFPTLDRFVRERRAGTIKVKDHDLKMKPSDTTIGADIVFLQSVLNWATLVTLSDGSRLLEKNPIARYSRPKTKNPRREVATYDRYLKLRKVANQVDGQKLFGDFLDLVESMGWRVSALCQLKASDLDRTRTKTAPYGRLRKRGEFDKEGVEMLVPLPKVARKALDHAIHRNHAIGERWVFGAPKAKDNAWTKRWANELLTKAEKAAKLTHVPGLAFHAFRRKWAIERKPLPVSDVAAAGGWRDITTLQTIYQQADELTMLAVMTEPRKLREAK